MAREIWGRCWGRGGGLGPLGKPEKLQGRESGTCQKGDVCVATDLVDERTLKLLLIEGEIER